MENPVQEDQVLEWVERAIQIYLDQAPRHMDLIITDRVHIGGVVPSIQASEYHHCLPQNNMGPWKKVEVADVTTPGEFGVIGDLEQWDDGSGCYAYVPVEALAKYLKRIGGFTEASELALELPSAAAIEGSQPLVP